MGDKEGIKSKISLLDINVLVVDDDSTTLSIVSSYLRTWNYKVTAINNPNDVMNAIETKYEKSFDLILSDLYMPALHGLELKRRIHERFNIPVIFMSANDKESVILHCLESGAEFYIVKPVCLDDVKNIWQYAVRARKGNSVDINPIPTVPNESSFELISFGDMSYAPSKNEENWDKNGCMRKSSMRYREGDECENQNQKVTKKKAKVVWTNSLHTRFLIAIRHIGFEKAVPKRILELMNVPGLSRENVASHLQKYRMFLRRVAEKGVETSKKLMERALKSTFAIGLSTHLIKHFQQQQVQISKQEKRNTSFNPDYRVNTSTSNAPKYPKQKYSRRKFVSQHRNREILTNQTNYQQQDHLYQVHQPSSRAQTSNIGINMHLPGGTSYGLMNNASNSLVNGTNSMQMYHPQTRAILENFTTNTSSPCNFGISSGILTQNIACSQKYNPALIFNNHLSTFGKQQMTIGGDMVGMNQMQFNNIYDSMDGNMNITSITNSTYFSQGESSSTGYQSLKHFQPIFTNITQPPVIRRQYDFENGGSGKNNVSNLINISHDLNGIILDQISNYQHA